MPTRDLADPRAWQLDVEEFEGWSGPFSALKDLEQQTLKPDVGTHKHCIRRSPTDAPSGFEDLTQVYIEVASPDSCIDWFAVDLYLDEANRIVAVRLDRGGP